MLKLNSHKASLTLCTGAACVRRVKIVKIVKVKVTDMQGSGFMDVMCDSGHTDSKNNRSSGCLGQKIG